MAIVLTAEKPAGRSLRHFTKLMNLWVAGSVETCEGHAPAAALRFLECEFSNAICGTTQPFESGHMSASVTSLNSMR